ncbi:hypothetical protein [Sediminitomix flava]|uniref:Uncharacterized protein n=1 Tax=Sediminitomix flava TaxID=379075 RepID=A0A315ZGR4_SEDFL|nr:hypothetical protein [Sediminitomix flava]PWJ44795.1 hypothetical protein BC781_1011166 [Sediminitomix flava]
MSEQHNYFLITSLRGQCMLKLDHNMKGLQKRDGKISNPRNYAQNVLSDASVQRDKNVMVYMTNVNPNDKYVKGWRFDVEHDLLYPISSFEWQSIWNNHS